MKTAHYFGSKGQGYSVRITIGPRPVGGEVIKVSGKKEARTIAAQHNAKPWNF